MEEAEGRLASLIRAGRAPNAIDLLSVTMHPVFESAAAALERLEGLSVDPLTTAKVALERMLLHVKFGRWQDFPLLARRLRSCLRGLASRTDGETLAFRRMATGEVGLGYARFLRKTNRSRHALRVLSRVARWDDGLVRHYAETEAGLIELEADHYQPAIAHLERSLNVNVVPVAGYSRELLWSLDKRGVRTLAFLELKGRLLRLPVNFRGWPER